MHEVYIPGDSSSYQNNFSMKLYLANIVCEVADTDLTGAFLIKMPIFAGFAGLTRD